MLVSGATTLDVPVFQTALRQVYSRIGKRAELLERVDAIPYEELWEVHMKAKLDLLARAICSVSSMRVLV